MTEPSAEPYHKLRRRRCIAIAAGAALAIAGRAGGGIRDGPSAKQSGGRGLRAAVATAGRIAPLARGEVAALAVSAQGLSGSPTSPSRTPRARARSLREWRGRTVLAQPLGHLVRALPQGDAGARRAASSDLGGPKFQVVAVNIDTRDPEKPLAFLKEVGVTHLAYYADPSAKVFQDLKLAGKAFGMPTTLIVDPSGCEIGEMAGPAEWASADGVKLVSAALTDDSGSVSN